MKHLLLEISFNPFKGTITPEPIAVIRHKKQDAYFDKPNQNKIHNALMNHFKSGISIIEIKKDEVRIYPLTYYVKFKTGVWETEPDEHRRELTAKLTEIELY